MAYGNFDRGGSRPWGNRNFKREMTKIKCSECGKEDEVPFKPRDGSTVLCKECYFKKKGITPREGPGKVEKAPEAGESEEAEISEEESEGLDTETSEDIEEEKI